MDRLQRLRNYFLAASGGQAPAGPYWQDAEDLRLYDGTLAQRIVWKWESVLREFPALAIPEPSGRMLDFGCGSGAVGQALLSVFPEMKASEFFLWDHSPVALAYTKKKLSRLNPQVWSPDPNETWDWVFVSHVLNELSGVQRSALLTILKQAKYVVLVEPGTPHDFKNIVSVRQSLRSDFSFLAPCTHSKACPLAEHPTDWCHHFAEIPSEVFADAEWGAIRNQLGIDMSSLPYSYLVLKNHRVGSAPDHADFERSIGTPRVYKGLAKFLSCHGDRGARELEFQKREDGEFFRRIKKGKLPGVVKWHFDEKNSQRVKGAEEILGDA